MTHKHSQHTSELSHGVRDLLEEDWDETTVEGADTFLRQDTAEAADETGCEAWLRDHTDTGGF